MPPRKETLEYSVIDPPRSHSIESATQCEPTNINAFMQGEIETLKYDGNYQHLVPDTVRK